MNYYKILVFGKVQGVGFRPYVYQVAKFFSLKGYVRNQKNCVEIIIHAKASEFLKKLQVHLPTQAKITQITCTTKRCSKKYEDFYILDSIDVPDSTLRGVLPQDLKICSACILDISKKERFYNYAFSTCVDCGPRYSIIKSLPYDRKNTTMKDFKLCKECEDDFTNPNNRRFHAQPLSCRQCAIVMNFYQDDKCFNANALQECAKSILKGKIIAIKGVGGFALVCHANNIQAIQTLRKMKNRPYKPFAVMVKDLQDAKKIAKIDQDEEDALLSKEAPIVLLKKKKNIFLDPCCIEEIAPKLSNIGIILPYSGLHLLLMQILKVPIIFTSANLNGEPIIHTKEMMQKKLSHIYDGILDYSREIANPIEDSVVQKIAGKIRILRLARGYAPLHLSIPQLKNQKITTIGMGGEQKVTLAYHQGKDFLISPLIGDLDNPTTLQLYENLYQFFIDLYQLKPTKIISDWHKYYHSYGISANIAHYSHILWDKKQHHFAHFCAIFADSLLQDSLMKPKDRVLGVIWDGTGLGEKDEIWGGEFILGNLAKYKRFGFFSDTKIYGGERGIKEIYKIAYSFAKNYDHTDFVYKLKIKYLKQYPNFELFDVMVNKDIQAFHSTSVGRMFDALACLCEICDYNSYDAQAPILLEKLYQKKDYGTYPIMISKSHVVDTGLIFKYIFYDLSKNISTKIIVTKFISTLVEIIFIFALKIAKVKKVLFSGGVFMNKTLCEALQKRFIKQDIKLYFHYYLPSNDSNIALGQIIEYQ